MAASRRLRLRQLIDNGDQRARAVLQIQEQPGPYFTAIQIGVNVVAILGGVVGEGALSPGYAQLLAWWVPPKHIEAVAFGLSFTVLTMRAFMATIPREIDEAAIVDGAGPLRRFTWVTLPMMRATLGAVISLGVIMTLQQFDLVAALTQGGPANTSQVAQYWSWQLSLQTFEVSAGSAVATLMLSVVLVVAAIYVMATRDERVA